MKERVLVLTAAGKTGLPTALNLRREGFPVTAFVHRENGRSERLKAAGADIVAGSLTDIDDMRRAIRGAQRAYFCTPLAPGNLKAAAVFCAVAAERRLQAVVAMSQWLASPHHPALHTRETWLADRLLEALPDTALTRLNPGFFADNDLIPLRFAAQFGLLLLAYGSGRNAPPSNEDMGAVAAEILARPEGHSGKTYRPTGPALLSPLDLAGILARVLGRPIRYVNTPIWAVLKVMQGMGLSPYAQAQVAQYFLDYQRDTFAVGAPTDAVLRVTGREPEDFETIARRCAAASPDVPRRAATQLRLMTLMNAWMLAPSTPTGRFLARTDFSDPSRIVLSADSPEWRGTHGAPAERAAAGS